MKINIPHMLIGLRELQHKHKPSRSRVSRMGLSKFVLAAAVAVSARPDGVAAGFCGWRAKDGWIRKTARARRASGPTFATFPPRRRSRFASAGGS